MTIKEQIFCKNGTSKITNREMTEQEIAILKRVEQEKKEMLEQATNSEVV